MTQSPNTMNFLPEDYVANRQAARTAVIFVGLLLVVVAGIVAAYFFKKWQSEPILREQAVVDTQYEDAEKKIAEANELDRQKAVMVAKAELATTLMERVPRNALLRQLTELQPPAVYMVTLDLTTKTIDAPPPASPASDLEKAKRIQDGLPPENIRPPTRDVTVDLVSIAPTDAEVARYVANLNKCPLLTDVNLLFSEEYKITKDNQPPHTVRRFHVEMKIDPKADLRQIQTANANP